jgi:hypothetical protein
MIQSGVLLNRASAAPTNAEAPIRRANDFRQALASLFQFILTSFGLLRGIFVRLRGVKLLRQRQGNCFQIGATSATKLCAIKILRRTRGQ